MHFHAPQWIIAALFLLRFVSILVEAGAKEKSIPYAVGALVTNAAIIAVLWWGGFWG